MLKIYKWKQMSMLKNQKQTSLEGQHPSHPKDASKTGDLSTEQKEVEDNS